MVTTLKTTVFFGAVLFCVLVALGGRALSEQAAPQQGSKKLPRAYEGAPPLIPHDAESRKAACLDCHGNGFIGAPIVPHPTRNHVCLQCHVGQDLAVQAFPVLSPREGKREE
jgi:nitrate reductase cytochrome c-type subunit